MSADEKNAISHREHQSGEIDKTAVLIEHVDVAVGIRHKKITLVSTSSSLSR